MFYKQSISSENVKNEYYFHPRQIFDKNQPQPPKKIFFYEISLKIDFQNQSRFISCILIAVNSYFHTCNYPRAHLTQRCFSIVLGLDYVFVFSAFDLDRVALSSTFFLQMYEFGICFLTNCLSDLGRSGLQWVLSMSQICIRVVIFLVC